MWNLESPHRKFEETYETQWMRRFIDKDVQYRYTTQGNYMSEKPNDTIITSCTFAYVISDQWSRIVDGTGNEQALGVSCDPSSNVFLTGQYGTAAPTIKDQTGTINFGTLPAPIGQAAFVSKFQSNGAYHWSRIVDATATEIGQGVACDPSSNVFLAGRYDTGAPNINDQDGVSLGTLPTPSGGSVAFVSKFQSNGAYHWSRIVDGTATEYGYGVTCDPSSNVFFTGRYDTVAPTIKDQTGTINFGTLPAPSGGSVAVFVSKFQSNGAYHWSRVIDGTGNDQGLRVSCDSNGNVFLTGYYGTAAPTIKDQDGVSLGTLPDPSGGSSAAFVSKFASDGTYQWSRIVDGTGTDVGTGVTCDSNGNVFLTGYYGTAAQTIKDQDGVSLGTLPDPSGGSSAAFVSKFASDGTYQWSRIVDGTGNDQGRGVTCDSSGNVFLTGYYGGAEPKIKDQNGVSLGTLPDPSGGSNAAFVIKFASDGTYQWSRIVDGTGNDQGRGVTCDSSGNVLLTGYYGGAAPTIKDQDGTSLGTLPAPSGGSSAAFVSKFASDGTYITQPYIKITGSLSLDVTYTILYNTTNTLSGATTLGTATKSEISTGKSFYTLIPTSPTYYVFVVYFGQTLGFGSSITPVVVTGLSATSSTSSITTTGTTNYPVTMYYNTTNTFSGATPLGPVTVSQLASGYTFSGLTLAPGTLYYVFASYDGTTSLAGTSTTSPAASVSYLSATSTTSQISVSGTANYNVTYSILYNTTNTTSGATSLGTATQAELTAGKAFTGLTLTSGTTYYVFVTYSGTTAGSTSTSILEYPPAALNANSTNISAQPYGNGTYIASSSTDQGGTTLAWKAFDKVLNNNESWASGLLYNTSGFYGGTVTTAGYAGEWIQIQLPSAITLTSYSISSYFSSQGNTYYTSTPSSWRLLGSSDGTSWTLIDTQTSIATTAYAQLKGPYAIGGTLSAYSYYRMVVTATNNPNIYAAILLGELRLFGY